MDVSNCHHQASAITGGWNEREVGPLQSAKSSSAIVISLHAHIGMLIQKVRALTLSTLIFSNTPTGVPTAKLIAYALSSCCLLRWSSPLTLSLHCADQIPSLLELLFSTAT